MTDMTDTIKTVKAELRAAGVDLKNVVTKRDGVDEFGLYLEWVEYVPRAGGPIPMSRQAKIFLAENMVVRYFRARGKKAAAWQVIKYDSHDAARQAIREFIDDRTKKVLVQMRGMPLLIQMTTADVEAVRAGRAPYARFSGSLELEKRLGKVDDTATIVIDTTP